MRGIAVVSRDRKIGLTASVVTVIGTAGTAAVSSHGRWAWAAASTAALVATGAQITALFGGKPASPDAAVGTGVRRVVNMPAPSAVFVDRKELLADFASFAKQVSSPVRARTFVIYGPSGFGKSRGAYACAEREFGRYDFIWLLDAGHDEALGLAFSRLARHLGLDESIAWDDLRDALWPALAATGRWLLVYDNVPDRDAVQAFLPRSGGGDVIVTTQGTDWQGYADVVTAVGPLPLKESVRLFQDFGIDSEAFAAETAAIAKAFGGRPLDMLQAASVMRAEQRSPRAYLASLTLDSENLPERDPAATPASVAAPSGAAGTAALASAPLVSAATPAIDYGDFRKAHPGAFALLALFCWFGSADIPGDLIRRQAREAADGPLAAALVDAASWDEAFQILTEYSLISGEHDQIGLHDGVRAAVRALSDPANCATAVRMLAAEFPRDPTDTSNWALFDSLAPHATQAAESAAQFGVEPAVRADLLVAVARYFHHRDYLDRAADLFRQAAIGYQAVNDSAGESRAHAGLSRVLFNVGADMPAAEDEARTALSLATEPADRCAAALALAQVLRETGRFDEGHEVLTAVLQPAGLVGQAPEVCLELANLARRSGRVGTALRDTKALVEAMAREYGVGHPSTGGALRQLGMALADVQSYDEARVALENSLKLFTVATGSDSQEMSLKAEESLGTVLVRLGRADEALVMLDHVVAAREGATDRNLPNIAGAKARRSDARRATGALDEALADVEDSIRIFSDLGSDGRAYLTMPLVRKGPVLADLGRVAEGEGVAREAVALSEESHGQEHLLVAEAYRGLAEVLGVKGDVDGARVASERAEEIVAAALQR
ncbi:tetratricopeptide repeat protein [Catenulispora sp. NF23]|uniref:tetratricopeptide repeat protein n=1 Tax=Catenulispora pinistramenti TaxID=2705254 RepID=UPI001BAB6998|nr:tetratricopeptide repeat protein [Catenulispora pinistramenti]MBS2535608.1 tetratricopeptide repeat protein [Catenulispora pinistramenti]